MTNQSEQRTPWGTIVSWEVRIAGEQLKRVLHYRSKSMMPDDYVRTSIMYRMNDGRNFFADLTGGKYALTDSNYNQLGEFPDRVTMTRWVKSHLVNN